MPGRLPSSFSLRRRQSRRLRSVTRSVEPTRGNENDRGFTRESRARRLRSLREHIPVRRLERFERREPATRKEADGAAEPPSDPRTQYVTGVQQRCRPLRLEAQQRAELVARPVERRIAEAVLILGREIHAPQLEVARDVLEEVYELEPRADGVARRHELRIVEPAQDAEHEPSAGVRRMLAVVLQVVPGLVGGDALVDAV